MDDHKTDMPPSLTDAVDHCAAELRRVGAMAWCDEPGHVIVQVRNVQYGMSALKAHELLEDLRRAVRDAI